MTEEKELLKEAVFITEEDKKREFYSAGIYDLSRFSSAIDTSDPDEEKIYIDVCGTHWDFLDAKEKELGTKKDGGKSHARVEILYGGAGSGKSFTTAQYLVTEEWSHMTGSRWYILRKTSNSLKTSSYHLIKFMCSQYNVHYKEHKTDKIITINGNELLFRGLDDPEKIKSTDVNNAWIEEATECTQDDFEQVNLRTRLLVPEGNRRNRIIMTFNPISKLNWIYKHFFHPEAGFTNYAWCKTTYLDNPFLDEDSVDTIVTLKNTNYNKYRIYALAEWGVAGKTAWETVKVQPFDVKRVLEQAHHLIDGIDWGYEDPNVLLKSAIDMNKKRVYLYGEVYERNMLVEDFAKKCAVKFGEINDA